MSSVVHDTTTALPSDTVIPPTVPDTTTAEPIDAGMPPITTQQPTLPFNVIYVE